MEWIVIVVLVVLLLAVLGPRAGLYGTGGAIWDIIGLIIVIALIVWILRLIGVLSF